MPFVKNIAFTIIRCFIEITKKHLKGRQKTDKKIPPSVGGFFILLKIELNKLLLNARDKRRKIDI